MKAMLIIAMLLSVSVALAETMQLSYKIYLSPSYIDSVKANTPYKFTLSIGEKGYVDTAFVIFKTYVKKGLVAELKVNGERCYNKYYISKDYMDEGFTDLFFDCSNVIKSDGTYDIELVANTDIGSVFGYAEITYMNEKDSLSVFGTEYTDLDTDGKLWIQLLDAYQNPIENALCFATVYKPDNSILLKDVSMSHLDKGIYYYDFQVPSDYGVYPLIAECYYYFSYLDKYAYNFSTANSYSGTLNNTFYVDGLYLSLVENQTIDAEFHFTDLIGINTTNLVLEFVGLWKKEKGDADNDYINFYYWNGTSYERLQNYMNYGNNMQTITNNIPLINNTIRIKINDTVPDAKATTLVIDKIAIKSYSLSSQGFREVKGSSEIHKQKFVGLQAENLIDVLLANKDILRESFVSNHNTCVGNNLVHNITYNYCIGNQCKDYSYLRVEECKHGCSNDKCNPNPLIRTLIFIAVVIVLPVLLIKFILKF